MPHSARADRRTLLRAAAVLPVAAVGVGALEGESAASEVPGLPDYAPVPSAAAGPKLNDAGYFVGRIDGHLHWVTDGFYQAMFLSTRDGVVLVDAPPTIGHNLLRAIADVTRANGRPAKVTHLVHSHSHADHVGASSILGKDVVRIGHAECRRLLLRDNDPNRPAPTVTFEDHYTLHVGGERLELAYHGPNHSPDNIFIHAPEHKTLMVVDILYPGWVPFKNLAVSQDIPAWLRAQDIAMGYPWRTLVGGHLGRLGRRADGDLQRAYMADLEASTRASMHLDPTPYFEEYGAQGNSWAVFKTYLDAVAAQAAAPVAAKYTGVLAAADVFTLDNAATLVESFRIDAGILGPFSTRP
ncbi:MBL fold metallo-hydrolase [Streptomyces sp. VRA16 Mangrove soil]|uniref:MBL fold metallo-hydrolase n=1 Tax=Streptomyces sp. VRA16 Mangrove soil TaxID=2817434 RepID=UPI001E41DA93|nr:MBL fold metallo-hydrolase [Streptomyces sp. VRA16 Mangrove soil]